MNMQNVKDLSITEGDVRTIHDSSGNLLWGRLAYDTKYAGDTKQTTYTGKNLFNYQGVVNLALSTDITEGANYRGYYIQANAGDTFTLSRATTTGNNRFRVCFTMVEPAQGVDYYNGNGVVQQYIYADNATEVSFTVPQDMHYVFIYLSNSGQDITESLKIQLETGSTATFYEPYVGGMASPNPDYPQDIQVVTGMQTVTISDGVNSQDYTVNLGSLELAKIGTYEDYIYKSGGNWYAHKATKKVTLDGNTTFDSWTEQGITGFYNNSLGTDAIALTVPGISYVSSSRTVIPRINGSMVQFSEYIAAHPTDYAIAIKNNSPGVAIRDIRYTNANDLNNWLTSNPETFYYALATATDTQITDTTLIAQLEAIHEWLTRYGYNSTVSGNLPLLIEQTNLS